MVKADRILRDVFPGREEFTEDERRLVERCITAVNNDAPRSRMPRKDMPVGVVFDCNGVRLKVVRRPKVILPCDACVGCYFKDHGKNCYGYRCSKFDRTDEVNVWFVSADE